MSDQTSQNQWQPIETAPGDQYVLLYVRKENRVSYEIGQREQTIGWVDYSYHLLEDHGWRITHWQPLPEAP